MKTIIGLVPEVKDRKSMFEKDNHLKNNHVSNSNHNNPHVSNSSKVLVNNLEPFKMAEAAEDKGSITSHLRPSEISRNFPGLLHRNVADSSHRPHHSLQGPKPLWHCHNKTNFVPVLMHFWNSSKDLNKGQSNRFSKGRHRSKGRSSSNNSYHRNVLPSHNWFNNVPLPNKANPNFLLSHNFKAFLETVKPPTNLIWAHLQPLAISKDQCSLYSLSKFNSRFLALASMLCVIQ